jgi:glycerate kinase
VISRTVLIATERFGEGLGGEYAGAAIGRGLQAKDPTLEVDVCPIELAGSKDARELLGALDFDTRMRAARAVVVGAERLDERTLLETGTDKGDTRSARIPESASAGGACLPASVNDRGGASAVFEIATRARQAGVPAYAVAGENALSLFDARILDLQVILQARDTRALRRAGEKLAGLI